MKSKIKIETKVEHKLGVFATEICNTELRKVTQTHMEREIL